MPAKDIKSRRAYHREYMRRRYNTDAGFRDRIKASNKRADIRARTAARRLLADFRRSGCLVCKEMATCCLSAHHLDARKKDFNIGSAMGAKKLSPTRIERELKKCVCLCENCHRKLHAGLIKL